MTTARRMMIWAATLALSAGGCARTVYVPSGDPVRIRTRVIRAEVWVADENGQPVAGVMDLPEGWYVLPDPGDE